MKTLRIILGLIFVALIVLLVLLMCQPKEAQIQVVDADTEKPIEDATVEIESTDKYLGDVTLTTDEDGLCTFKFRDEKASLNATASADGYESAMVEDVDMAYFKDDVLIIPLRKLKKAEIQVVEEETGRPIPGATVRVKGSPYPGDIRLTTDADGMCSFLYSSSQTAIDTILAMKEGFSCAIYNDVLTDDLARETMIIPLEKLKTCDNEIKNTGLPSHAVQAFFLGDYDESDNMEFQFKYWTCSYSDHIKILNGSYQDLLENKAECIFDFTGTTDCDYTDETTKMLPIKGPNIFVIVDNAENNSSESTAWGYYVGCPEPR